ncbi:glycosyltransferase family 2 protein [Patiriisocius sp. Uisw_017]|uniref:glycosyltransferase family 2 protein n=1 Tax=Patiriisocius sp. Uisw_017 TaxID=3230968 RepID=UPI0039EC0799
MNPLVSIIIPTYNRASLIIETLDSILLQTYKNWECIIVDDGSTDNTDEIISSYILKDSRFQYYHRPIERTKGGNACRNFGFEVSKGDYIQWFDSDDLMVSDHISTKINTFINNDCDFVVAQTANFNHEKTFPAYKYTKMAYGITFEDFIQRKIHWYTYDVLLVRGIAEKISYHELMKSWQDYYYFCMMLLETTSGVYIDKVLTKRRLHSNSIQDEMNKDKVTFHRQLLEIKILTYKDLHDRVSYNIKKELIFGLMNHCFQLACYSVFSKYLVYTAKEVKNSFGLKSMFYFYLAIASAFSTKKGDFVLKMAKGG